MIIREGHINDLTFVMKLAMESWQQFESVLAPESWKQMHAILETKQNFVDLITQSHSFLCETESGELIGMSFLVPSGNPTTLYDADQSYIRFVTVSPQHSGKKLGQILTEKCIDKARELNEQVIRLHTSEMMPAARHIYKKLGFEIVRELEPIFGKRYWLYELRVGEEK